MKTVFKLILYIISAPLELIKYPVLMALRFLIWLSSIAAIAASLIAYFNDMPEIWVKVPQMCLLAAGSALAIYLYDVILYHISPFYEWARKREERLYYDKEYRLDDYKNRRRDKETGFNAWDAQEETYYIIRDINRRNIDTQLRLKEIEHDQKKLN